MAAWSELCSLTSLRSSLSAGSTRIAWALTLAMMLTVLVALIDGLDADVSARSIVLPIPNIEPAAGPMPGRVSSQPSELSEAELRAIVAERLQWFPPTIFFPTHTGRSEE